MILFARALDGELLAQLHLHPGINNGFVVLNYKKYAKNEALTGLSTKPFC